MHLNNGILVSEWAPEKGVGKIIRMRDMMMAIAALHDMEQSWKLLGRHQEMSELAVKIIKTNANFLLKVQNTHGGFSQAYDVKLAQPIGPSDHSVNQWEGVRALLAAYYTTENLAYLQAARKAFNYVNEKYWVEEHGVYRTALNNDSVIIEPYSIGIALGAMREMLFASPAHIVGPQIERITRWWIQTVDQSGSMQAETKYTGEIYTNYDGGDDDADGIPYVSSGYGKYGTAPLIAAKVVINIGAKSNKAFHALKADTHDINRFTKVKMQYLPQTTQNQRTILIPENFADQDRFFHRKPMQREDGSTIPLQAALILEKGMGTINNLTGQQIFMANCSICHGEHGEGIVGKNLGDMMNFNYDVMFHVVQNGRFEKSMPPWGAGNDDGYGGTLKKDEIDRIIAYVQSEEFRSNYKKMEDGKIIAGQMPKDIWFYLSRENVKSKGKHIANSADAKRIIKKLQSPADIAVNWWENIRLNRPSELELWAQEKQMHNQHMVRSGHN